MKVVHSGFIVESRMRHSGPLDWHPMERLDDRGEAVAADDNFEVDRDALRHKGSLADGRHVARVNDALHLVDLEPTARSTTGGRPDECSEGDWVIRRHTIATDTGEIEVSDYHALRGVS